MKKLLSHCWSTSWRRNSTGYGAKIGKTLAVKLVKTKWVTGKFGNTARGKFGETVKMCKKDNLLESTI